MSEEKPYTLSELFEKVTGLIGIWNGIEETVELTFIERFANGVTTLFYFVGYGVAIIPVAVMMGLWRGIYTAYKFVLNWEQ